MPDRLVHLLYSFLEQNGGRLSRRARENEFSALTDEETAYIEATYADLFGPQSPGREESRFVPLLREGCALPGVVDSCSPAGPTKA
jgi:hypothetical protein